MHADGTNLTCVFQVANTPNNLKNVFFCEFIHYEMGGLPSLQLNNV
jgi:hypothetical protein